MRRRAAGHEAHLFEMHGFSEFLREAQMAKVDRIESAAENGDRPDCHGYRLKNQTPDVRQHVAQVRDEARALRAVDNAMIV